MIWITLPNGDTHKVPEAVGIRLERLEAAVEAARELREAEYNYHSAISCDEISQTVRLGNITREARAKLDAAIIAVI